MNEICAQVQSDDLFYGCEDVPFEAQTEHAVLGKQAVNTVFLSPFSLFPTYLTLSVSLNIFLSLSTSLSLPFRPSLSFSLCPVSIRRLSITKLFVCVWGVDAPQPWRCRHRATKGMGAEFGY